MPDSMRKAGWHPWASDCHICLDKPENDIVFGSGATVKTHKPVGEVACRLIHTSTKHALSGLSTVADKLVAKCIAGEAHMALTTADVIRNLDSGVCPPSCFVANLDIKDLFMSGKHETILNLCCQATAEEHRDFIFYITSLWDSDSGQYGKVVSGTGMGARHSGSVSDLMFHCLAENNMLEKWLRSSKRWGLLAYIRFRDDILAIFADHPQLQRGLQRTLNVVVRLRAGALIGSPFGRMHVQVVHSNGGIPLHVIGRRRRI